MADGDEITTASEFLAKQSQLEREAAQALPGKFDRCTFERGYCRQPVYACLTCSTDEKLGGFCYGCSISCHGDHEVLELFVKSHFRCDCGDPAKFPSMNTLGCSLRNVSDTATTATDQQPTVLSAPTGQGNMENQYNHNFSGRYCWCNRFYDAEAEDAEVMLQCVLCEDWFHESCIKDDSGSWRQQLLLEQETAEEDFVCSDCVKLCPWLLAYTPHYKMILQLDGSSSNPMDSSRSDLYSCKESVDKKVADAAAVVEAGGKGQKRVFEHNSDQEDTKRPCINQESAGEAKFDSVKCLLSGWQQPPGLMEIGGEKDSSSACCSLLFPKDLRSLVCRCDQCQEIYRATPKLRPQYTLLDQSAVVEPEPDEKANRPLYEAGIEALQQMDENRLKHCLSTFNSFNEDFREFLKPFGESGKVVTKQDIDGFFQRKRLERCLNC